MECKHAQEATQYCTQCGVRLKFKCLHCGEEHGHTHFYCGACGFPTQFTPLSEKEKNQLRQLKDGLDNKWTRNDVEGYPEMKRTVARAVKMLGIGDSDKHYFGLDWVADSGRALYMDWNGTAYHDKAGAALLQREILDKLT